LSDLSENAGDKIKYVPESFIKGKYEDLNLKDITSGKYLVVTGVKTFSDIDKGFLKSVYGGDSLYDTTTMSIVTFSRPKIIIFCSGDPEDYLHSLKSTDMGFSHRISFINFL
jgi:hypothetical protein